MDDRTFTYLLNPTDFIPHRLFRQSGCKSEASEEGGALPGVKGDTLDASTDASFNFGYRQ
jgi:hypothetical protein